MPKLMKHMNSISRLQAAYRTARMGGVLGGCQHSFVLAICRAPGRSQEELARDLCLNKSTVARTLAALETDGYLLRTPNPADKRELLVYPTEKMQNILPEVRAVTREWNERLCADIPEEELAVFFSVLTRMTDRARELADEWEVKQ